MRIAFYMSLKPPGHPKPSGDLIIGTELLDFLKRKGHTVTLVSKLRMPWIYWKPWMWPRMLWEIIKIIRLLRQDPPHIWLTYHTYYKAPDLLGPLCAHFLGIPYVIFQGIYSTKRRRKIKTWPGFILNRQALLSAEIVFTNKERDEINLRRIVPEKKLFYVKPGIDPDEFVFDKTARQAMRSVWDVGDSPVVLTAAMFRSGVKIQGLALVIESCGRLLKEGLDFKLVIAGDGPNRGFIENLAREHAPGAVLFSGQVRRGDMHRFYSGGDLFVFPGVQEGLGMVYLEAQSCGLPVVAYNGWGAREAVVHTKTGLLCDPDDFQAFRNNIAILIQNEEMRRKMGSAGQQHVRENHDTFKNYPVVDAVLSNVLKKMARQSPPPPIPDKGH